MPDSNKQLRVLVIDDNVDAATMLSRLLDLLGCRTATAFDGFTAQRLAVQLRPDLLIVDLNRPEMDGCEVLSLMRKTPSVPRDAHLHLPDRRGCL